MLSLAAIREKYAREPLPVEAAPHCPRCGHAVTVEKTEFFESLICENCFDYWIIDDVEGECCRSPDFHKVKMVISGGGIQVREQCRNCGYLKSNAIAVPPQERALLPLADLALKERSYDRKWDIKREANIRACDRKAAKKKTDWMAQYSRYLISPEWRQKRELVLRRDNYLCQCCLSAIATQVHHKSYEFVDLAGNEPAFDLAAVCTPCHEQIETMKKQRRNIQ